MIAFDAGAPQVFGAIANGTALNVSQWDEAWFHISGTFVGTITFRGSFDGVTFTDMFVLSYGASTAPQTYVKDHTIPSIGKVDVEGLNWLRADCTAWTSGSISVDMNGTKK